MLGRGAWRGHDTETSARAAPLQFATSSAWQSAEAAQNEAALPEPETTGWGSTLVGELMKAKVGG